MNNSYSRSKIKALKLEMNAIQLIKARSLIVAAAKKVLPERTSYTLNSYTITVIMNLSQISVSEFKGCK